MLFLAVFCGFLAEYQLEHVIEHQREKTFMRTLSEDLDADANTLERYSGWRAAVGLDFDSLLVSLSSPHPDQYGLSIYRQVNRSAMRFGLPDLNEGTIQQLKNAGGLRLIRQKEVVSAINKHYLMVARMRAAYDTERLIRVKLMEAGADLLDAKLSMDLKQSPDAYSLVTRDRATINRYMNHILAARATNQSLMTNIDSALISSVRLKELIQRTYAQ